MAAVGGGGEGGHRWRSRVVVNLQRYPTVPPWGGGHWTTVAHREEKEEDEGKKSSVPTESAFALYVFFGVLMTYKLGTNMILIRYVTAISPMKDSKS